jgi:nucleoside-diphosphate-sugar epimerase
VTWRVAAKPELPERAFDAQQRARAHRVEQLPRETTRGGASYVHLEQLAVRGRAGQGEAAAAPARHDEIDVLAGAVIQVLDRWQLEEHRHHVIRQPLHALDAARQALDLHLRRGAHLARLDRDVGQRVRLAQQHVPVRRLFGRDARRKRGGRIGRASAEQSRATRGTVPALAAVRQVQAGAQRSAQHGFVGVRGKAFPGGHDRDLWHRRQTPARRESEVIFFAYALEMDPVLSCLIVGCGYVGSRFARREAAHRPLLALVRSNQAQADLEAAGIHTLRIDLDALPDGDLQAALAAAANEAAVVYLAPPPATGRTDPRLESFLAQIGDVTPRVVVYISTTGVYGDASGELVDESTPVAPANDRSRRRVAAESAVQAWCASRGVRCVILRVPGIYGPHRLPLERLQRLEPALCDDDAGPGNRIHVDDLAAAIVAAVDQPRAQGVFNVTDGDHSSTTAYLRLTAEAAGLAAPPLISTADARDRIPAGMLSFLLESRRVDNHRMLAELGLQLRYPTLQSGVLASLAEMRLQEASSP